MDDHRASALCFFCPEYYKHDRRVKDWLDSKWSEWERDPPAWFDDAFIGSLPRMGSRSLAPRASRRHTSKIIPEKSISKLRRTSSSRRTRRVIPEEEEEEDVDDNGD